MLPVCLLMIFLLLNISDHRALEILFKKPLYHVPPRIAEMMLKVQKYDL